MPNMDTKLEERKKIISEIISTELSYVEKLQAVIEVLILPLREAGNSILEQNELQFQFGSWEMIYGIHKDLYDNMLRQQAQKTLHNIPQMFHEFSDYLRLYKTYVMNFEIAMNRRAALMINNKRYATFIEKTRSDIRCRSGIEALLIIPIQRIPRYQMLLEQLLKYYDANDPTTVNEYRAIQQSLLKIKEVADENNQSIKLQENKRAVMEVMMSIETKSRINLLDNPTRRLIKSGILKRLTKNGLKEYMFWLFSDKLLYGEANGGVTTTVSYILRRDFALSHSRVLDGYGHSHIEKSDTAIIFLSTLKTFIIYAKSTDEKMLWLDDMTSATRYAQNNLKKSGILLDDVWYQPLWVNESGISSCQSCKSNFKMFATKQHCRGCGIIACDDCCQNKAFIPHFDDKKEVNVCKNCFKRYMRRGIDTTVSSIGNAKDGLDGNKNISKTTASNGKTSSSSSSSSVATKQELQKQLKLRNEVLQQLDKTHTNSVAAATAASQSAKNRCGKCTSEFSMLKSKQTCMNCGSNVCSDCSRRKFLIPYVDPDRESKVCNDCYFFLVSGASIIFEQSIVPIGPSNTVLNGSNHSNHNNNNNNNSHGNNNQNNTDSNGNHHHSTSHNSVQFESAFDLDSFMKFKHDIQEDTAAAVNANKKGGNNVRFSKDDRISGVSTTKDIRKACLICAAEFSLFKGRQTCKSCGSNVCGDCHRRKCIIPSIHPTKETQVCETCYFVNAGKNKQQQQQHIPTLQTQQSAFPSSSSSSSSTIQAQSARNNATNNNNNNNNTRVTAPANLTCQDSACRQKQLVSQESISRLTNRAKTTIDDKNDGGTSPQSPSVKTPSRLWGFLRESFSGNSSSSSPRKSNITMNSGASSPYSSHGSSSGSGSGSGGANTITSRSSFMSRDQLPPAPRQPPPAPNTTNRDTFSSNNNNANTSSSSTTRESFNVTTRESYSNNSTSRVSMYTPLGQLPPPPTNLPPAPPSHNGSSGNNRGAGGMAGVVTTAISNHKPNPLAPTSPGRTSNLRMSHNTNNGAVMNGSNHSTTTVGSNNSNVSRALPLSALPPPPSVPPPLVSHSPSSHTPSPTRSVPLPPTPKTPPPKHPGGATSTNASPAVSSSSKNIGITAAGSGSVATVISTHKLPPKPNQPPPSPTGERASFSNAQPLPPKPRQPPPLPPSRPSEKGFNFNDVYQN